MLLNLLEVFNLLQVGYCSWLLLLWLTALYLVTGLGGEDDTLRCFVLRIIFPGSRIASTVCTKIALRSLILGIALPVMAFTIITFPMVLFITIHSSIGDKMLQVLYIGGSKVSLPDACADVFQPRCSLNL